MSEKEMEGQKQRLEWQLLEEGSTSHSKQMASRSGKARNRFSHRAPRRITALPTAVIFAP